MTLKSVEVFSTNNHENTSAPSQEPLAFSYEGRTVVVNPLVSQSYAAFLKYWRELHKTKIAVESNPPFQTEP